MRSTNSGTISFGLVSIPVKFYTSASSQGVAFNLLTPKGGNRVQQKNFDSVTGEEVTFADCDKGYEVAKGEYVRFTKDELKSLEAECEAKAIDITEFIPVASFDPIAIEKTYYLGPDKGADKGYVLLSQAMTESGRVAVAQWNSRGKEHLVVIRPYKEGLVLHQMFYANEIRDFSEIEVALRQPISPQEHKMALKLLSTLSSDEFDPSQYEDSYTARVKKAVEDKLSGGTIKAAPADAVKVGSILDIGDLLERSLVSVKPKAKKAPKAPEPKKPGKK
jgi:DNA end-binding protein Ku